MMKSKNMRRGFNEIPMGHGGGARGESGDALGPSGNHAKCPPLERYLSTCLRKRESKRDVWPVLVKKKGTGDIKGHGLAGPTRDLHSRTVRGILADRPLGPHILPLFHFFYFAQIIADRPRYWGGPSASFPPRHKVPAMFLSTKSIHERTVCLLPADSPRCAFQIAQNST